MPMLAIFGKGVLTPLKRATKENLYKWDFLKLKSFYTAQETITKMKNWLTEEKIFTGNMYNKGLISKILKSSYTSKSKNQTID